MKKNMKTDWEVHSTVDPVHLHIATGGVQTFNSRNIVFMQQSVFCWLFLTVLHK